MNNNTSKTIIRVVSILNYIEGAIYLLGAAFFFVGGAMLGTADPASTTELVQETGMSASEMAGMTGMVGAGLVISGIMALIIGFLGMRAYKDPSKIMPVWVLSIISLVLSILALGFSIFSGSAPADLLRPVVTVAMSGLMFWAANNIKTGADELSVAHA